MSGTSSFNSSRRFWVSSVVKAESPVMLPPGRDRLFTRPASTGSPIAAITIGMVLVAFLAASAPGVPRVTRMSHLRPISSATRPGSRSLRPSCER